MKTPAQITKKKIGRHDTAEVEALFSAMLLENFNDGDEKPHMYIIEDVGYNAIAINALFFDSLKKINAVAIGRDLFDYLNMAEIRAITAHEIGHFKKYIRAGKRALLLPAIFKILSAYLATSFLAQVFEIYTILIYLPAFGYISYLLEKPFVAHDKEVEYLADLYAGRKYGKLDLVNALTKIYQANVLDTLLNIEAAKFVMTRDDLEQDDIPDIQKRLKPKVGRQIFDEAEISQKARSALMRMNLKQKPSMTSKKIQKRNKALQDYLSQMEFFLEKSKVNWDEVDSNERDGMIDEIEYGRLIEILKDNPDLPLFREQWSPWPFFKRETHPRLRQRILFLDKNC